jgi:hypothetical protein
MTQVDLCLTRVGRFDSADPVINVNDVNQKHAASQYPRIPDPAGKDTGKKIRLWVRIRVGKSTCGQLTGSQINQQIYPLPTKKIKAHQLYPKRPIKTNQQTLYYPSIPRRAASHPSRVGHPPLFFPLDSHTRWRQRRIVVCTRTAWRPDRRGAAPGHRWHLLTPPPGRPPTSPRESRPLQSPPPASSQPAVRPTSPRESWLLQSPPTASPRPPSASPAPSVRPATGWHKVTTLPLLHGSTAPYLSSQQPPIAPPPSTTFTARPVVRPCKQHSNRYLLRVADKPDICGYPAGADTGKGLYPRAGSQAGKGGCRGYARGRVNALSARARPVAIPNQRLSTVPQH